MTLSDEAKLWVFENTGLRTVYGRIEDENSREWRERHIAEPLEL